MSSNEAVTAAIRLLLRDTAAPLPDRVLALETVLTAARARSVDFITAQAERCTDTDWEIQIEQDALRMIANELSTHSFAIQEFL
jgi:hypothetical protein